MPNTQQTTITEILDNIAMSCRMEGLEMTDEIRAMCLAIYNGSTTLQDCLNNINAKYISKSFVTIGSPQFLKYCKSPKTTLLT